MALKVAIIGCGKIADGHIEEIQKLPSLARLVAVADLELLMAEQAAVRYAIPNHYDDIDRMLAIEKPDVVHITTPPQSHLALGMKAIDAGAHVYVEKPLTLNHADSKRLVDHAVAAGKQLTIGYSYLFDPPAMQMRAMIAEGLVGEPVHIDSIYGYNLAGAFGAALLGDGGHWVHRLPGKLFHNNIDHLLNKLPEFLDDDGTPDNPLGSLQITATGSVRREARFGDVRDEMLDELRVMITGGKTSAFGLFSSHIKPAGHHVRVHGTRNTLFVDYVMRTVTLDAQSKLPSAFGRLVPAFDQGLQYLRAGGENLMSFARNDFHYFSGLNRLFAMYYASILEGGPPPIPYRHILRISAMMDEIFRQVPQHGKVAS